MKFMMKVEGKEGLKKRGEKQSKKRFLWVHKKRAMPIELMGLMSRMGYDLKSQFLNVNFLLYNSNYIAITRKEKKQFRGLNKVQCDENV